MIKVFVQKTMAQAVVDTPLTSGSKGLTVEFVFSEDWNGLEKTAVFETSSFYKETEQLTGETIEVPEDVMAWANETLYVGVYGTSQNGATVIPTVYADCGKIQKGANDSEGGRPLIPAQSDILQNQIDSLGDRVAWLEETGGGGGGDGILLDTTLTQSGKAADAKAVGDALEQKQDAGNYLTDHNTFVGDVNTSSAAFYEAFSARKPCFLLRSDAGSGMVMWVAHDCTSRAARFYNVTPDGTVRYATLEGLVFSYESAAGGSGNVFVGDENTTVAEFYEAYNAGNVCFLKRAQGPSGTVTWVSYNCTQYYAFFYHVTNGGAVMYARLSEDGTWTTNRAFSDVVKSVNGITPDLSGKVTLPIPTEPSDIGAQPAGNYATKDEIPTTLPNPHKLTFSGAVSAEYDGSEAVEVVIPQGGGVGGGKEWSLLNVMEVTEEGVLRIDVTETADGVPLADLGITKFVTFASVAYGTKPNYPNYMTLINGEDVLRNMSIAGALTAEQRRSYHEFIGSGAVWYTFSEVNGAVSAATTGFAGGVGSGWEPTTNFGEKLDSFCIYLYDGSFKVGSKIMLWGC